MEGLAAVLGLQPLQALLVLFASLSTSLIILFIKKVYGSIESLESGMKNHSQELAKSSKEINEDMLKIKNQFTDFKTVLIDQVEEVRKSYNSNKIEIDQSLNRFQMQSEKLTYSLNNLSEINDMVKKSFGRVIILEKITDSHKKDIDNNFKLISKAAEKIDAQGKDIKELKWKK